MHHLDTDVVVDFLRGDPVVLQRVASIAREIAISTPVLGELYYGAYCAPRTSERLEEIQRLLAEVKIVLFDAAAAEVYGRIRTQLRQNGRPIGEMDTLIGAIAVANQATLVTRNLKHFRLIDGLRISDCSIAGGER